MCGIFAFFLNRPLGPDDIALGRAGTTALRHRGPHGSGEWIDREAGVFLGHTRLPTFDPSAASHQPMERDGNVIAFNGEIFNFRELRADLEQPGHRFSSRGDTEVLLRAWRHWGEAVLDRLDGAFALVHWDGEAAQIAIDPFGEKMLFLAETERGVYVSSELPPLTALLGFAPDLSGEVLTAYLALGHIPTPRTAFREITRIPPATRLDIRRGRITSERRYWRAPMGEPGRGRVRPLDNAALNNIRDAILGGLKRRLTSDVPLCLYLSSGVDSTLVGALAKRELDVTLPCLTMSYPGTDATDEAVEARALATHLGLPHQVIEGAADPDAALPERLLALFGQPSGNIGAIPILQLSEAARAAGYHIGLTGSGGDELFLGFGKTAHFYRHRALYGLPDAIRLPFGALARALAEPPGALARFGHDVGTRRHEQYVANKSYPAIAWLRGLEGFDAWARDTFGDDPRPRALAVAAYEISHVMPDTRFVAADVSSMRASLTLRAGLTSRAIADAVAAHDPRAFLAFGQKSVLRRLLSRYVPPALFDLPKRGFVFPQAALIERLGDVAPSIPGLSDDQVATAWRRRHGGRAWEMLAVRLAVAAAFHRAGGAAAPHAPPLPARSAAG